MGKYTEEELFNMSDEELQLAMEEEKADMVSPEVDDVEQPEDEESAEPEEGHDSEPEEIEDVPVEEEPTEDEPTEDEPVEGEEPVEEEPTEDKETDNTEAKPEGEQPIAEEKKYKYKANGQEFEFTQDEVISEFGKVFGQSMNYTKKMQAIAPYRKMISAMEEEKLTEDDMNLMIDALKGNKDAITAIVKRANVDVLDLNVEQESEYVPNSYGRDESELKVKEIVDEIAADKEFPITQSIVTEQWDAKSRDVFAKDPELIKELHIDVVNGVFDKVAPMAMKMKVLDGAKRSDLDYYVEAGRQYHMEARAAELRAQEQQKVEKVAEIQQQRTQVREAAPKRKAATIPKKRVSTPKVTDYLEDTDEAFEEWYNKLQESM